MNLQTITQILQTVSTPIANPASTTGWDDLLVERKTKFEVDPLACSVSYLRQTGTYGMTQSKDNITEEDYSRARQIREYYSKKYFWNSLKSTRPQSEFRANAQKLLAVTEDWNLTDRETGFFVKLPAFYAEDTVYDGFVSKFKTDAESYKGSGAQCVTKRLEFLAKTFRWQQNKRVSYWFKDEDNRLYGYTTFDGHPFNALFEEKIERPQIFEFSRGVDNISTMWYNAIKSFSILKEQNA